jgi:hypothetical protein
LAKEADRVLPFFVDWVESGRVAWPDGGARLSQPVKLAEAFDMMSHLWNRYKAEAQNAS